MLQFKFGITERLFNYLQYQFGISLYSVKIINFEKKSYAYKHFCVIGHFAECMSFFQGNSYSQRHQTEKGGCVLLSTGN